ncbi:MAG: hypothetical protein LBV00_06145 [Propionibacteriaceae bacterium]|jgi:multidrug/hemolysin transport system permease protein|nr:hypothetical protein [Propionibacteriaceae bacterium]
MIGALFTRNLRVFLRSRAALAITVGGPVLFTALFLTCLGSPLADTAAATLPDGAGTSPWAIADGWSFATAAALSAFSSSISFVALISRDRRRRRWGLYSLSPAKPWQILAGCLLAVALVVFAIGFITVVLSQAWAWAAAEPMMSPLDWLLALAILLLMAAFFAGLTVFVASFRWSQLAFGAYCLFGVVLLGFWSLTATWPSGAALPRFFAILPFAEQAAALRQAVTASASGSLPESTARHLGIQLGFGDGPAWSTGIVALLALIWALIALIAAYLRTPHLVTPVKNEVQTL